MGETETVQTIGPWVVRSTWDVSVSALAPVRVVIEADPNASPADLAGGISSTVLRDVRPPGPAREDRDDLDALTAAVRAVDDGLTDAYLAALARLYVAVAPVSHSPSGDIGAMLGKPPGTVKNALTQARKRELLTTIPHRRGGELTAKARKVLGDDA